MSTDIASMRRELHDIVERALALLDALDGDPDLEPWLGWTTTGHHGDTADLEEQVEGGGGDDEDSGLALPAEPNLRPIKRIRPLLMVAR